MSSEKDSLREAYEHALETARKILIILHHEDPAIQMGASMIAAMILFQQCVSVHDEDGWMESAESVWDHRDEIGFDLFGKPVTTMTH